MSPASGAHVTVYIGRGFLFAALLALLGAWLTQLTGATLLGMTQQHLFSDATALAPARGLRSAASGSRISAS